MIFCTFCGAEIPEDASFCGNCGQVPIPAPEGQTSISSFRQVELRQVPANSGIPDNAPAPAASSHWEYDQSSDNDDQSTLPLADDDEERRRRAAMVGMGVLAGADLIQGGSVPTVQGTPQMGGVPSVPNPPAIQGGVAGGPMEPGWNSAPTNYIPQAPGYTPPVPTGKLPTHTLHYPHPKPVKPAPKGGCAPLLIIAILIPLVIIGSIITLGFTVFAPNLSLSGSSNVASGGTLALHGSHFFPGSGISLMLDNTTPLFVEARPAGIRTAQTRSNSGVLTMTAAQLFQPAASNAINADGNGSFNVTITVDPGWSSGQHTIQASESITHRSAQLTFTIVSGGATPTPSTGTATVTPSPTLSPTVTSSPTGTGVLSCVNPASVTLGPVSNNYTKAVSTPVTLCTAGTGSVNWTATWNAGKAPWLAFDHSAGTIAAPGQATITVFADAAQQGPGNYSATVTFTSQPGNVTQSLNVSFIVQAGCISGSTNALTFNATLHVSEAPPQTISLTNCGAVGNWSASAKTTDGASWLSATPTSGTLNANTSLAVTISASTLNSTLAARTYKGTVTFAIGSGAFSVNVTFNVQDAARLSISPTMLSSNSSSCRLSPTTGIYNCSVTVTNTSTTRSLSWTSSTNLLPGAVVNPPNGTLGPGKQQIVLIKIPDSANDCSNGASITFSGPANSVTLPWTCQVIG